MYIILVIFLVNTIISAQDSSSSDETRYIDLLQDKEKNEFLERIARRIFDEVQSKDDGDRASGELSDTQLDEHDAYVKKILAEESLNRRKSDDPENMNEKNHVKNESLDIKDVIQDNIGEAGLVNFTLREGKRSKRNNLEKSIEDSTIIHISSGAAGEKKNPNNENKLSNAQAVQEKDETDVEDIQIKYSRRNVAENTNEFEITSESSDLKRTQIIDFEAEVEKDKSVEILADPKENVDKSPKDTEKSQKNIRNSTNSIENIGYNNSDENVEIINSGSTKAAYDSQEDKNPETEKNSHEKDFEKDSHEKNTHEKDFQEKDSHEKDSHEKDYHEKDSHEKDSHGKDSDEKDEVTKDIINTTTSKPSSLLPLETVQPTKATTVKLSNKNVTTTEVQNIITHGRVLRSYTEAVTLDNNKTLFIKNDTKDNLVDGLDEGLSAVAVGNLNELKTNANLKKEDTEVITDAVHESEVTELQSDEGFSDKTTNTDIQENTTKKTIDIDSTTLKTEVLTVAALRNKGEANIDEEESYVKELTSGKEYTHKPNNNIGKSIEEKTNSNASVGANVNLTSFKNPHTNLESQGKIREFLNSTMNSRDDGSKEVKEGAKVNKNIYDLGNDIIKVLTSGKEYTHKPNNNMVSIEEKTNSNASVGDSINLRLYKTNKTIYDLGNDIIKVIRTRPGFGSPEKNLNYLRPMYETMKAEEYKVYEVPEEKQPYLKKDYLNVANKENPYYVPIYNYSPDNAYYNPHNRLGPNADDENEHIIINTNVEDEKDDNSKDFEEMERVNDDRYTLSKDIKRLFRVYNNDIKENKNKFRFEKTKPKQNNNFEYKLNLPVVVKYPKFTDIILNPSDYLDMDDYYGRNLNAPSLRNHYETEKEVHNLFTDSSERDHSMNKMHEGNLKTSIKSIRQMMHRQKIFGFVPPTNFRSGDDSVFKSKSDEDTPTHTHSDYKIYKTIITDQVYGSKNDDTETRTHLKKKKTSHPNKARYIPKDKENIKEPYNDIFKNPTIVKNKNNYLNIIPYKGKNYLYNDIKLTTPAYIDVFTQYYNTPRENKNKKTTDFETIKKISSDADKKDVVSTLEKLLKLNLTTTTKREENYVVVDIEPYVMVLEDMVRNSNRGLEQYNWLGTTVDIQAALMKLMQMIDAMQKRTYLSTPDAQLLKYFIYLHKSLKNGSENAMRKAVNMPRNKRKKKGIIKDSGLLNRTWLVRMLAEVTKYNQIVTEDDLQEFNEFLNDLQFYLYDLHTALQQITLITKYKSQRWFENLKELYLDTNRKNLLEVLLHMTTSRLLDLVEDSAKKGVEDDFLTYTMKNVKEVGRTKEELAFVLKVIEELKLLK